ncbi:2-oxoglutarate ferredoxin oxidoreductase subunit alpha [Thermodesulfobium acidiphilum]|uniref:2-oxoglutarate ferredoxin oxidoreductase subunit alpha n=1 Tax=Thermodesulfobium acidiphilum TaxID=1794699 RepID=A0A2R4W008_THEAF|nr:2-oxoacid:acceptor oxidoreductase subunit alpha [Thermodesulfobium acidiphilum]AWB10129.1 2-oxoglutarate ferredoxin oxidoreductase subunit alpha [Thermodesulfobium acidiphilum]
MSAKLIQGNEAVVYGAIKAGLKFFAGYPITPSTEIAEMCARDLPKVGGVFIQMEDEISSIAACIGASLGGFRAMSATSGPGFSLMQENIGYAIMAEVSVIIVNVQRMGPSTGIATAPSQSDYMQVRWGTHGDHPMVSFAPFSVEECFTEVVRAFYWSERISSVVVLLLDEVVAHMREGIDIDNIKDVVQIPERGPFPEEKEGYRPYRVEIDKGAKLPPLGTGYRFNVTGLVHDELGFPVENPEKTEFLIKRLHNKVDAVEDEITSYDERYTEDAEVIVISYGSVARSSLRAVRELRKNNVRVGFFRPITVWPFPSKRVRELSKNVKNIIVAEMSMGQMVLEVRRSIVENCNVTLIQGIKGELITPDIIYNTVNEVISK